MARNLTRREALRNIGAMVTGTLLLSAGGMQTSCDANKKAKRLIFYFTGTGNSLYVARQLAGENGQLLSIPQLMKRGLFEFEAEEIGMVFPTYSNMPPRMVKQFMAKAKLKADYFFAVPTFGAIKATAVENAAKFAARGGTTFNYIKTILMVDVGLHFFDINKERAIDKHIPEQLEAIKADINSRKNYIEETTDEEREFHNGLMAACQMNDEEGFHMQAENRFNIDADKCVGCGTCVEVCPHGNYRFGNRGLETNGECDYCMSCVHNCPQKAITFKPSDNFMLRPEPNPNARFRNPNVTLVDIKRANRQ